jgi:NTP pyrophosphatase (non-canonical NTP hydrolase)
VSKRTLRERTDDMGDRVDRMCDEFVEMVKSQNHDKMKDKLQDIIFRSIVYYNMNQDCVKQELEESYEKIKNK